jgi:hypothetical protein
MKTTLNGDFKNEIVKPKAKKIKLSVGELVQKIITDGRYKDLLKILEPHEIPKGFKI